MVNHVYIEEGEYTITLTVVDKEGRIGNAQAIIQVLHRNEQPVASLDATLSNPGNVLFSSCVF